MKVFLFNVHQWNGDKAEKLAPAITECSRPNGQLGHLEICLLWEEGRSGGADHYSLLIPTRKSASEFAVESASDDDELPDDCCIDMSSAALSDRKCKHHYQSPAVMCNDTLGAAAPSAVQSGLAPSPNDFLQPTPRSLPAAAVASQPSLDRLRKIQILQLLGAAHDADSFLPVYNQWYEVRLHTCRTPHVARRAHNTSSHQSNRPWIRFSASGGFETSNASSPAPQRAKGCLQQR